MAQLRRAADDFKQTWEAEVESERSRLAKNLSSDVKLPDLSVDLTAPSPDEPEVMPAEGSLARASARPAAASSILPPVEALAEALPAAEVSEAPLAAAAPAVDALPVEAPADAEFPRPVFVPRPGAVEAVEAIGYEG